MKKKVLFQAEKSQVELKEALESTKKALEERIDELLSEKEGAITAVRAELVESSRQSGKEKVTSYEKETFTLITEWLFTRYRIMRSRV